MQDMCCNCKKSWCWSVKLPELMDGAPLIQGQLSALAPSLIHSLLPPDPFHLPGFSVPSSHFFKDSCVLVHKHSEVMPSIKINKIQTKLFIPSLNYFNLSFFSAKLLKILVCIPIFTFSLSIHSLNCFLF